MIQVGFRRHAASDLRTRLIVAPHHPDRLRRPPRTVVNSEIDSFRQALTWNVFRTLELIAPSFWLRRLHVRLTGDASLVAPQVMGIRLWPALSLPSIQLIDGRRPDVVADVVIETEHDVWTILVPAEYDTPNISEAAADLLDAGVWLAGRRSHHCGVIERHPSGTSLGSLLKERYGRSRESASLRSATRGPAASVDSSWGVVSWGQLAGVLHDCAGAPSLPAIEQALATNAVEWLRSVGIEPAD